jgi:hypothetical protein
MHYFACQLHLMDGRHGRCRRCLLSGTLQQLLAAVKQEMMAGSDEEAVQRQIDCPSMKSADNSSSDYCCGKAHSGVSSDHLLKRCRVTLQ